MTERTITVQIDPEVHGGKEPKDEAQRLTWEILDTAWNLLREGAVRLTLQDVRAQLVEQGFTGMPSDEELFREGAASGDLDAPKGYLDLAPERGDSPLVELAAQSLYGALQALADVAMAQAASALGGVQQD